MSEMVAGRYADLEDLERMPKWATLTRRHSRYLNLSLSLHEDIHKIVMASIDEIDADDDVKQVLREWAAWARTKYASTPNGHYMAARRPVEFVAWLGEVYFGRTVTIRDLSEGAIDGEVVGEFWRDCGSDSESIRSHTVANLRAFGKSAALKKGLRRANLSTHNPFADAETNPPDAEPKLVEVEGKTRQVEEIFHTEHLKSWFGDLLAFDEEKYIIFSRFLLATGLRPGHARLIRCQDIDTDTVVPDALGREFNVIYAKNSVAEFKKSRGARITIKKVPFRVYVSPGLAADMLRLCEQSEPDPVTGWTFVFPDLVDTPDQNKAATFGQHIISRKKNLRVNLVDGDTVAYTPYSLRRTWASVMYTITKDLTDLQALQNWKSANIAFGHYTRPIARTEALAIAEEYGIFIPSHREEEVKEILEARARVATKGDILEHIKGIEDIEDVDAVMQELMKKVDDLKRRSSEAGES